MKEMKRILSLVLCLAMLVSMIPGTALTAFAAEGTPTIVVAGSDYQASTSATTMQNIGNQINGNYDSVYGILMGGDYDAGKIYPDASHLTAVDNTIANVFPGIDEEYRIMIQGNHETYGNLSPSSNSLLDATGKHDTDHYGVYAINYEDFGSAASGLQTYLNGKTGYTKPIFVMSHQPLHETTRDDNNAAVNLFNVLNNYEDLNIIFLFGHNHSGGYDAYLGNGSIYLPKGSNITVAGGSTSTLNFTYMNYGYVGYVSGSSCTHLTMTAFEIYEDEVIIKRYDADSQHMLKEKGATVSGYNTDANEYGYAVLSLSDGSSTTYDLPADSDTGSDGSSNSGTAGGSGYTYELVTSVEAGEKYVIVGNDDAVALMDNGGEMGTQSVTISGTTLTSTVALTEWTISGTDDGTITSDASNQLGYSSSSWNLTGDGDCTFDIAAGSNNFSLRVVRSNSYSSRYYFYYDGSAWAKDSSSAQYVRLYKYTGAGTGIDAAYIRLSGELQQTYTIADAAALETVLGKLLIQTSDDGSTVNSETLAVTADMVTWDSAFDGKTAGTYTGTVAWKGYQLGTVTVTVNAEHNFETITVEATCTEDGSVTTRCTICGQETVEILPAAGHKQETETREATCTEDGSVSTRCTVCGEETVEIIEALGHAYECAVTDATCGSEGSKVYTCARCADTYTETIPATQEHTYESVTVDATCEENGATTYTCGVCGHSYAEVTPALGHNYTCVESDGYLVYTCHCGDSYSEKLQGLTYTKVSSVANDQRYVITLYSGSRYYALSHEGNKISAVQVTVSNGEITSEITEELVWSYNGGKLSYENDGTTYYLYAKPGSGWWGWFSTPTLTVSASNSSSVSFSNNRLSVGYYNLYYANGTVSLNWGATTTYFFVEE